MRTPAICAAGIALIALAMWYRPAAADDFPPFYRAATLASSHGNVYANPTWSPRTNAEGRFLPYLRIPFYAAALRPLTAFSYTVARRVWIAALVLAAFACVPLFPAATNRFAIALAFSFPLADALMVGQDITFVLLIVLAAARIFSGGREFLAGLLASLVCIKITWAPAVGMVFLAKSRRGVGGFAVGTAVQLAISFAVGGMGWPSQYLAILRNPLLDPEPSRMLSIRELTVSLSLPAAVYMIAAAALYVIFWFACRRLSLMDGLTLALALGLIAAPHCKIYDAILLIPLLVKAASLRCWEGVLACACLTPVFYLMVLMGRLPVLLVGDSLLIVSTLAAALRLYRDQMTPNARHARVPTAMATP
ncbi:MAG: glycosyltransferase family 87 protein [Bryobacteraceae bacterium]